MRLKIEGATLYLGRRRLDGYHNVERVRLKDWYPVLLGLKKAKLSYQTDGECLLVQPDDPRQLKLSFMEAR